MFYAAMHLLQIKDLKDLSIFYVRRCYRHAGPKGPEEIFSYANARGGLSPALRFARPSPFTVVRGPVPRHASVEETALAGVHFSRGSDDRGGQAPALRAREGFFSPCAVRDQAIPNYSFLLQSC